MWGLTFSLCQQEGGWYQSNTNLYQSIATELHHAATWIMKILQSIRCHCKVTWLPLCLYVPPNHSHVTWLPSWRHWTVNIMPLRLQMPLDNQLTQIPLSHWTTTLFPDYQWKTEQQILFQSSATWLQIYFHSAIGIPLKLPDYQWITTQQILFQSSATSMPMYIHSAIGIPLKLPDYQLITT